MEIQLSNKNSVTTVRSIWQIEWKSLHILFIFYFTPGFLSLFYLCVYQIYHWEMRWQCNILPEQEWNNILFHIVCAVADDKCIYIVIQRQTSQPWGITLCSLHRPASAQTKLDVIENVYFLIKRMGLLGWSVGHESDIVRMNQFHEQYIHIYGDINDRIIGRRSCGRREEEEETSFRDINLRRVVLGRCDQCSK